MPDTKGQKRESFVDRLDELTKPRTVDITVKSNVDSETVNDNLEEQLERELITNR